MLKTVLLDYNPVVQLLNRGLPKLSLLADLANYIRGLLFEKEGGNLEKILFLLGVTALTFKAGAFLTRSICHWNWIPRHIIDKSNVSAARFKSTYGDCFVLITGFTQGIGRGYAEIFAEYGFNLLLLGRNKDNVEQKVAELKRIYPLIRIEHIVSDLSKDECLSQLESQFDSLGHLDIGIVINNAGTVVAEPYLTIQPDLIVHDYMVDLKAVFIINRLLLPRLRARNQRSAIVNISSITGYLLTSRLGIYSSAKLVLDVYSRCLTLENRDKVDILSLRPMGVCTKMMKMKKGPFMVSPRSFAQDSLGDLLGGHSASIGHALHKVMNSLVFAGKDEKAVFRIFDKLWEQANIKKKA